MTLVFFRTIAVKKGTFWTTSIDHPYLQTLQLPGRVLSQVFVGPKSATNIQSARGARDIWRYLVAI